MNRLKIVFSHPNDLIKEKNFILFENILEGMDLEIGFTKVPTDRKWQEKDWRVNVSLKKKRHKNTKKYR